jgi:putative transposase
MISMRKMRFILKQYREGTETNRRIRKLAGVSKSTFYRIVKRFGGIPLRRIRECLIQRGLPGRKPAETPLCHVQKVIEERMKTRANDRIIAKSLNKQGIRISHCKVYDILASAGLIHMLKGKRKRKKWVRWQRKHSLSLWQTDWTDFGKQHLMVIMDDASRLVVGWGLFDNATSENSVNVLKEAIRKHGKPKAMLTGRDIQFFSSAKLDGRNKGKTYFQKFLEANDIKHVLARVNHPQTCGKIERFFGEVKKRINTWHDFSTVDEVVQWHNSIKPHMSLGDEDELVTPADAFAAKLHHNAKIIKEYSEAK